MYLIAPSLLRDMRFAETTASSILLSSVVCEAMPYSGKADFELIGVHGNLLLLICSQHSRQELIAGHVSKLI